MCAAGVFPVLQLGIVFETVLLDLNVLLAAIGSYAEYYQMIYPVNHQVTEKQHTGNILCRGLDI